MHPGIAGFVLGKPFWAVPEVLPNPKGGSATGNGGTSSDPAHELLMSEGLSNQFVQIPGMDGFFMYQLQYQHVSKPGCSLFSCLALWSATVGWFVCVEILWVPSI